MNLCCCLAPLLWLLLLLYTASCAAQLQQLKLSLARGDLAATVVHTVFDGDFAFFAGGSDGAGTVFSRVDLFSGNNSAWNTRDLSRARSNLGAAQLPGIAMFAGGISGSHQSTSDDVDVFYFSGNNEWMQSTAKLSQPRAYLAATSVNQQFVMFAGGWVSNGVYSNMVDIYNEETNQWTNQRLSQPRARLAAASIGPLVLFGGGINNQGPSNVVDMFNVETGSWNTAALSEARYDLTAVALEYVIVFVGGCTAPGVTSSTVDIYNVQIGRWVRASLPSPRAKVAAATYLQSAAVFAGGYLESDFVASFSNEMTTYSPRGGWYDGEQLPNARSGLVAVTASSPTATFTMIAGGFLNATSRPTNEVDISYWTLR